MIDGFDRRAFLCVLGAAGAVHCPLAALASSSVAALATGGGGRVVVLGPGLAGLGAACGLTLRGCDVAVLEARERSDGRVQTARGRWRALSLHPWTRA